MGLFYVKCENVHLARKLTLQLQERDKNNTYICPKIALSHLAKAGFSKSEIKELKLDILSFCDKLILCGESIDLFCEEISFAQKVKMEVYFLEESGKLQLAL